ncbi:MAG: ParB/RepB/Spo0J family partition protein [Bosea sp. (in: a-proteobacteria)]
MVEEASRPRLGRGLAALIGEAGDEAGSIDRARGQKRVPIEFLRPSARNPRRQFNEEELEELAASIRERGVLQPIIVRGLPGLIDVYEIIAGERRWRASQRAGLHDVPVIQVEASDREAMEIAIIENVQRADLNAMEEAAGYEQLMAEHGYNQSDLSRVIGKSRPHVANTLRLLKLPDSVRAHVTAGDLSAGHARALLALPDPAAAAKRVIADGLSVREVERMAQPSAPETKSAKSDKATKDPDTRALEAALEDVLGLKVNIEHKTNGGGILKITYKTLDQLDSVCRRLKH